MRQFQDQAYFAISIVSKMLNIHPQTIRHYENLGLIKPSRTPGNVRLYSKKDLEILKQIHTYTSMGVNLAGVEIIVKLLERMNKMEQEMTKEFQKMQAETEELHKKFFEDEF